MCVIGDAEPLDWKEMQKCSWGLEMDLAQTATGSSRVLKRLDDVLEGIRLCIDTANMLEMECV